MQRREFLAGAAAAIAVAAAATTPTRAAEGGPKKACEWSMLSNKLSLEERFQLAKAVGFDGVEVPPITDPAECESMRAAAAKAGIPIHSVIYGGWSPTLSDPDPAKRELSIKNAEAALHGAAAMGAETILLVPAVVNAQTRYQEAWDRAHEGVRKLIPTAEKLKVLICIEEVWNNFLLSPLEYVRFIDSFRSPWVQAYFDVGNVVTFAWPEDWIRTVGHRIRKVHLKDYKGGPGLFGGNKGSFVNLREGSINWPEVRKAFAEIGYTGFMTTELGGGDEAYLRDVAHRVDLIFEGK